MITNKVRLEAVDVNVSRAINPKAEMAQGRVEAVEVAVWSLKDWNVRVVGAASRRMSS